MLGFLIALRNFTIAVLLAWMGFSVAPDNDEKKESSSAVPASNVMKAIIG